MFFEKEKTLSYLNTRSLLIRHMADYSNTKTAPRGIKAGWYALVTRDTGEVWLAETKNVSGLLTRYHHGSDKTWPARIKDAKEAGQAIDLFLATKADVDIDGIRDELILRDQLLERAEHSLTGDGYVYVIRHDTTHDFYMSRCRNKEHTEFDMLTKFYNYAVKMSLSASIRCNQRLHSFVTKNAKDILNRTGFTAVRVSHFKNAEEALRQIEKFVSQSTKGECLNVQFGKH